MPPSLAHEVPIEMLRRRPDLGLELLLHALEADGAGYSDAREESVDMGHRVTEARADSVVSVKGPDGRRHYLIIEVQRRYKPNKVWSWIGYVGGLMARKQSGVILLVICPDENTAAKYREGIRIEHSCVLFVPVVLSPRMMPRVTDPEKIQRFPEFATLAAAAHPDDLTTALAVAKTLVLINDELSLFYYDFLREQLHENIRIQLEESMLDVRDRLPDRFTQPIEDAAEARGERRSLLAILDARGLQITDCQRAAIKACHDRALLLTWTVAAATATTAAEVFDED